MAAKKNKKAVDDSMVKWPKKLSKLGEYLKSGKKSMFPGVKCDMRAVMK